MNQTKTQNAALFVAALSVCFGLLIVGAPNNILAQAVSTKPVRYEPVVESAPDDSDEALKSFLDQVRRLVADGTFDLSKPFDVRLESDLVEGKLVNPQISLLRGDDIVFTLTQDLAGALRESNYLFAFRKSAENYVYVNKIRLDFSLDKSEAVGNFTLDTDSPPTARQIASAFKVMFDFSRRQTAGTPEALIYQNAQINFENNQVFIVTRLPRASLTAILKGDGKTK
jgi:hypothetical protein